MKDLIRLHNIISESEMEKLSIFDNRELNLLPGKFWSNQFKDLYDSINLELPGLNEEKRKHYEVLLNDYFFACGCQTGALFLVFFAMASGIFFFTSVALLTTITFGGISLWVITAFGISMLGKLLGLTLAFNRLTKIVQTLSAV